jgi:hypothetical protein
MGTSHTNESHATPSECNLNPTKVGLCGIHFGCGGIYGVQDADFSIGFLKVEAVLLAYDGQTRN